MADIETAWDHLQQGETYEALKITTALAKADPDDAAAWYIMSRSLTGERADLFHRKAVSLDPDVASRFSEVIPSYEGEAIPTTFLDETPDESGLATVIDDETPTEYFAVPDVRPKVKPLEESTADAADAKRPEPRKARARRGFDWNLVGLVIVSLLILVVLYLFINTLIG